MEVLKSQTLSKPGLESVLGMKGGDGDSSYANNSLCQLKMVEALKPILEHSIQENMRVKFFKRGDIFRIADFGCGTGRNTLLVADTIVRALQCSVEEQEMPEFQVPESVRQRRSGRVYVSSDCEEGMGAAYLQQFDKDFTDFLNARGREIFDGGCIFISLVGRNAGTQLMEEQGILGNIARHFEYAFEELVNEGIIEKEKWESFYMPWFGPNLEELENIVEKEGSFEIMNMKVLGGVSMHPMTPWKGGGEDKMFGRFVANQYRALFENIIEVHLGCGQQTNEFFFRIDKRASILFEEYVPKEIEMVVALLTRKDAYNKF